MKVGFYQFAPVFGDIEANLNKAIEAIEASDANLVVLPELFTTGYQFISKDEVMDLAEPVPGGRTTGELAALSKRKGIYIAAGLAERDGDKAYNSAILTGPEGFIGLYRKTHLFYEETLYFAPGDTGFRVWETDIGKIGLMVCFDWFFPESIRTLALRGAQIVAHPSNLVLPYCPDSMPVRCLENHVFAVTANRVGEEKRKPNEKLRFIGKSRVVAPDGCVLMTAGETDETLLAVSIEPHKAIQKSINRYNDLFRDRRTEFYE